MTNTTKPDEVLKTDVMGRVRTPVERREALLDEFEGSGLSGQKFASLVGVKYQTFASWMQRRRKLRGDDPGAGARAGSGPAGKAVQWLEAVTEARVSDCPGLCVELPGGAVARITDAGQAALVATLLRELARAQQPC